MDYGVKYVKAGIFDHERMAQALAEVIVSINQFDAGHGAEQVAYIIVAK